MQQSTKISEYLKTVCEQIRWKRAHEVLSEEIENHIIDQKNAFMDSGMDEETAVDKAIQEMGDPILVGSELDSVHRPRTEWSIILLTAAVILIGFAIRAFITYDWNTALNLGSEIFNIAVGTGCMTIAYFLDFTFISRHAKKVYFGVIAVIIFLFITEPWAYGRNPYVQFAVLLVPTIFAGIIHSMRTKGYLGIILCGLFLVPPVILGILNRSFSSVLIVSVSGIALITLAVVKGWFNIDRLQGILLIYITTAIAAAAAAFAIFFNSDYRQVRFEALLHPALDPAGSGYITILTRKFIAGAQFFGPGNSAINNNYRLAEINTDFLLTYLIHRFGWIAFILVVTLLSAFIVRAFILSQKQKSVLGKLVSASVLITFALQVLFYIISNLGFQLFAPPTLPLISYSGSSLAVNMTLIGIMLSVFKSGDLVRDSMIQRKPGRGKFFEIVDGKIIIDLNFK